METGAETNGRRRCCLLHLRPADRVSEGLDWTLSDRPQPLDLELLSFALGKRMHIRVTSNQETLTIQSGTTISQRVLPAQLLCVGASESSILGMVTGWGGELGWGGRRCIFGLLPEVQESVRQHS